MHWLAALIIITQLFTFIAAPVPASWSGPRAALDDLTITDQGVQYDFGQQIDFLASIELGTGSGASVREVLVYITPESQQTSLQKMTLETPETPAGPASGGNGTSTTASTDTAADALTASASVDVRPLALYPFSKISYYYKAILEDNQEITSDTFSFYYEDNRFTWRTLEDSAFQVHWTGSDSSLGQMILNIAEDGLQQAQGILVANPPGVIRIYAYNASRDLQSALQLTNQQYVAGHATPELGMMMISVPSGPERKLELERQIPHEIMHILQYQVIGKQFARQPMWLIEGMASLAELTQNPEYRRVLETTAQQGQLMTISSLCSAFPPNASGAFLAYAESDSFVRFLHQKYGTSGLRALIDAYQNGLGCEEGVSSSLGVSLRQVEYRWQQEALGMNAGALAFSNLSPYLLLGLVVLLAPVVTVLRPHRARKPVSQGSGND